MKRYALALLLTSSVALAGDGGSAKSAKSAKGGAPIAPPKYKTPIEWFAGASGGYLLDNESGMVHGHIGIDLPWKFAGFNHALFAEVGWTECGDDFELVRKSIPPKDKKKKLKTGASMAYNVSEIDTDLEIIPITLNWKLERMIASRLSAYLGAGAGVAVVDIEASGAGLNGSDDDVVFFGQVFAGLVYQVTDNFELYGGVRGIYMDEPDLSVRGVDLDGHALETDLLLEGGGRVNF